MLCDNSVGVLYNDSTRLMLHEDGQQLTYLDKEYAETNCTMANYSEKFVEESMKANFKKKVSLVNYFRKYMNEHLLKVRLNIKS